MGAATAWASRIVLLTSAAGMGLGLLFDLRMGGVATLAGLCLAGPRDLAGILALHWEQLPGMHLGMVGGALAAVPLLRRLGCRRRIGALIAWNLACSAWMIAGMGAGALALTPLAGWTATRGGPAVMLVAMLAGMVCGMVASRAMDWLAAGAPMPRIPA